MAVGRRDAATLHALREAVRESASRQRVLANAIAEAREAGASYWAAIGGVLGAVGMASADAPSSGEDSGRVVEDALAAIHDALDEVGSMAS